MQEGTPITPGKALIEGSQDSNDIENRDDATLELTKSEQNEIEAVPNVDDLPVDRKVNIPKESDDKDAQEATSNSEELNISETNGNPSSPAPSTEYSKHMTYEGSTCIYTDPSSGYQYTWDAEQNNWIPRPVQNNARNTGSSSGQDDTRESSTDAFTKSAPATEVNEAENSDVYESVGDVRTYTDPNDGSQYIWDDEKNAWFPKIDDEFLARYQLSYGIDAPIVETKSAVDILRARTIEREQKKDEAKRKVQEPATWFEIDEAHNASIYIIGLPLDVTLEELKEIVSKFGLLARDDKGKDKIKLYKDSEGQPKGDALVTYIKVESVNLALNLLDGSQVRGHTLSVERAKFQMKGTYDPALKPKRKKKDKDRAKKVQDKLLDWRPEPMRGEPLKCERVVIVKNLFSPEEFDKEVTLILEYQQDLRAECSKCGDVRKVVIYDRHPDGVAQITFGEPEAAQACVQLLNGRWFAQKQISAAIWDGKTKYKIVETDAEIETRLAKWDKFLEDEDEKNQAAKKNEAAAMETRKKTD